MSIRLNKAIKEFNVGLQNIVDYLNLNQIVVTGQDAVFNFNNAASCGPLSDLLIHLIGLEVLSQTRQSIQSLNYKKLL